MKDLAVVFLLCVGSTFSLAAAVGVLKFPDLFTRMHAASKSGSLGGGSIMLAVALHAWPGEISVEALLIIVFFLLTAPVAAHAICRAAYVSREPLWRQSVADDPREHGADLRR